MTERRPGAGLARPSFTRQAQCGRRVIFSWRPADASAPNPLTTPWPGADELIEGVEFVGGSRATLRPGPRRGREWAAACSRMSRPNWPRSIS